MATPRICKFPGCGKINPTRMRRGYCGKHYSRLLRNGDPAGIRTEVGAPLKFIHEVALKCSSDDCLIWPFARSSNGYPLINHERKIKSANGLILELSSGAPIPNGLEVAHSCGKGHLGCVNVRHLSLKTPLQNTHDKFVHGTMTMGEKVHFSKLTGDQVREVRRLRECAGMTYRQIGERFDVSVTCVRLICCRKNWKHIA